MAAVGDLPALVAQFVATGAGADVLQSFQESEAAWGHCLNLLGQEQPDDVKSFASNVLLQKAKTAAQLTQQFCEEVFNAILPAADGIFLQARRLVLSAAAIIASAHGPMISGLLDNGLYVALSPSSKFVLCGFIAQGAAGGANSGLKVEVLACIQGTVLPSVFSLAQSVLGSEAATAEDVVNAVQCLEKWALLGMSLSDLLASGVLGPLCVRLQQQESFAAVTATLTEFASHPVAAGSADAVSAVVLPALAGLAATYTAAVEAGADEWCNSLVVMLVATGKALLGEILKGAQGRHADAAMGYLELLLACVGHHRHAISEETFSFWEELADQERDAVLGVPLYTKVVLAITSRCAYPQDFASWHSFTGNLDEDEFGRYRRSVRSVLGDVARFMQGDVLDMIAFTATPTDGTASTWAGVEVALFMMTCISDMVLPRPTRKKQPPPSAKVQEVLDGCFRLIFTPEVSQSHMLTMQTGLDFVAAYAHHLTGSEERLTHVEQFISAAYQSPHVEGLRNTDEASSIALRQVCRACETQLAAHGSLDPLVQLVTTYTFGKADHTSAKHAVEGIIPVILAGDPQRTPGRLEMVVQPLIAIFHEEASDMASAQKLLSAIKVLSVVVQFLDSRDAQSAGDKHPFMLVLGGIWADLDRLQKMYPTQREVLEALCSVYEAAVKSGKALCQEVIPNIITACLEIFEHVNDPFALAPLASAVELHGATAELQASFTGLFDNLCQRMQAASSHSSTDSDAAHLMSGYLNLIYRALVFSPAALSQAQSLPTTMQMAAMGLGHEGRELFRASCTLLAEMTRRNFEPTIVWLQDNLKAVVEAVLSCIAHTGPMENLHQAANLLFFVLQLIGTDGSNQCLTAILSEATFASQVHVTEQERGEFVAALTAAMVESSVPGVVQVCMRIASAYRRIRRSSSS